MKSKHLGRLLAVVVVIGVGLVLLKNKPEPISQVTPAPPTQTPKVENIVKVYTNTKYGYQIAYESPEYTINAFNSEPKIDPEADTVLFYKTALLDSAEPLAAVSIAVTPNPKALSPEKYFKAEIDDTGHTQLEPTKLGGQAAVSYGTERGQYILVTKGKFAYTIYNGDPSLVATFTFSK